jgi:CRISPR-associated protein Cmr4
MRTRPFLLHALSPLHAGTGQAAGIVDLPIARYRASGIPFVPGSSIKGVLRDVRRAAVGEKDPGLLAVFGPETGNASEHAGALVVGDARLLALPVRSFRGTFAWVSSPLLLELARRDLGEGAPELPIPQLSGREALVTAGSACLHERKLYLEDLDLSARHDPAVDRWAAFLAPHVSPGEDIFTKRFVLVDDDTMSFLSDNATQLDARVRLDSATRTVAKGALWLEESLPPESLLVGLLAADRSRRNGIALGPDQVLDLALAKAEVLQFGGKASVGRGRCRIVPIGGAAGGA